MKKNIALILAILLLLSGCSRSIAANRESTTPKLPVIVETTSSITGDTEQTNKETDGDTGDGT